MEDILKDMTLEEKVAQLFIITPVPLKSWQALRICIRIWKKLLSVNKDIDACICVDGFEAYGIVYQATGVKTMEATFKGIGGHAYLAFGKVANPLYAAPDL